MAQVSRTITVPESPQKHPTLTLRLFPTLFERTNHETTQKIKDHLLEFVIKNEESFVVVVKKEVQRQNIPVEVNEKLFEDTFKVMIKFQNCECLMKIGCFVGSTTKRN